MENFQKLIQQKTGWPDVIVRFILTTEEADIYINAGLKEATVNGNPALIQSRIDSDYLMQEWGLRNTGKTGAAGATAT